MKIRCLRIGLRFAFEKFASTQVFVLVNLAAGETPVEDSSRFQVLAARAIAMLIAVRAVGVMRG
jgi:hypothetical protein